MQKDSPPSMQHCVQQADEDQELEVNIDDLADATLWKLEGLVRRDALHPQRTPGKGPGRQVCPP